MIRVSATMFRKQCIALLNHSGPEGIVITRRGRPAARVIPEGSGCASLIGSMKGKVRVKGDAETTGVFRRMN